jgi:hypothetical protein
VNALEAYYGEERERAAEAEINKKFIFSSAYRKLQEAKRCQID